MRESSESAISIADEYRKLPINQEANSYSRPSKELSYAEIMDAARQKIQEWADQPGNSLSKLSQKVGKSHSYFQQFIGRGSPKALPEDVRHRAAAFMGIDEAELRPESAKLPVNKVARSPANARVGATFPMTNTIPAYGHARGGRDGQFVLNGNRVADIVAPPILAGILDAYAVYVVGESMEPRYFAGEVAFVNPRMPVRQGDFVVAQIADEEGEPPLAYVKRFHSMDAKRLRLMQYNPRKTLEFPRNRVVSVHRIIMGGDG